MIKFTTLVEALEHNAFVERSITYIEGKAREREVTFATLYERALGILHLLQKTGLRPGDELIIFLNNNEQFIDVFWASLLGGIVPVPVAVGISDEHRHKLLRIYQSLSRPYLYTDRTSLTRLEVFAQTSGLSRLLERVQQHTLLVEQIHDISTAGRPHTVAAGDTAFIQFSSGSTSEPKGVVLTHHNVLTNINAIIVGAKFSDQDVSLSWMPLTHDMGLIGFHLNMLVCGIDHHLMPTELFVRRPMMWLQKIGEKKANITCSPNFGYKHVLKVFNESKLQGIDLSHVRLIFNGAEPISARLCDQFLDRLGSFGLKKTAMFTVYGLAEASLAVSFPEPGKLFKTLYLDRDMLKIGEQVRFLKSNDRRAVSFVNVGSPVRDCQVRVVNDSSAVLAEDRVGHIYIKGDNVTGGYLNNEQANHLAFDHDGWLDTGDLGFMSKGELVITGRAKDIIFVNGQNYFPHDLESIAQQAGTLELGKVVVAGTRIEGADVDDLLVFILFRGAMEDFQGLATEVRRLVNERAGLEITHVIPVKRIPKTTSGKVQRHRLEEQYQNGDYSRVINELQDLQSARGDEDSVARTKIEHTLQQICDTVIPNKRVGLQDNLFEIGASSLALVEIHEAIEQIFPGKVDISDLFEHPTIGELAEHLERRMG